jgi:RND family efflux transporter MFP subunit
MKPLLILTLIFSIALSAESVYTTFDVEAEHRSDLTLTSTGVIETILVDVGDRVKTGERLLSLENEDLRLSVALARAEMERAAIEHRFAKQTYERYAKVRDVIDDDLYDRYRQAFEQSGAALNAAKASLAYREALLAKSILIAPYDGVIAERHKEVGDGISGAMLEPILTLIGAPKVKLVLEFDEKYWQKVHPGAKVTYRVDGSEATYHGVIDTVYPTVDPKSRKARAELLTEGLRPGLFGEGTIEVE